MNRKNVDQRFPEEGRDPDTGKPGAEDTGHTRKRLTRQGTQGEDTDKRSSSDKPERKHLTTAPRISKAGDRNSGYSPGRHDHPSPSRPYTPGRPSAYPSRSGQQGGDRQQSYSERPGRYTTDRPSGYPDRSGSHSSERPSGVGRDRGSYQQDRQGGYPPREASRPYGRPSGNSGYPRPSDPNRPGYRDSRPQRPSEPNRSEGYHGRSEGYQNRGEGYQGRSEGYQNRGEGYQGRQPRPQEYHRPYDQDSPRRYDDRSAQGYQRNAFREDSGSGHKGYPKKPYGNPKPLGPGRMYAPPLHPEGTRINRYIANAGICSRRDADKLVESGDISINGKVVTTLGTRIDPGDVVAYKGDPIQGERLRYILLNKPKGYITSNEDPEGRATVMELIADCCSERLFPVGRLDRNTTGLLLFTNDGHLAEKLMHPRNLIKKLYHIKLNKALEKEHMKKIISGIKLEDGFIQADDISYVGTVDDRTEVGMEIHSGKNRIVRRIFESFGYDVIKLDRVMFAGLTKKDLRRGKWRHLTPEELNFLKML